MLDISHLSLSGKAGTIFFDGLAKSLTSVVGDDPKEVIITVAERLRRLRDQNLNLTQVCLSLCTMIQSY
jgi:hypothetical protein